MKNYGAYERSKCWETSAKLGRALPSDCHSWSGSVLPRGPGGKTFTPTVEHSQLEEVLSVNVMCCNK